MTTPHQVLEWDHRRLATAADDLAADRRALIDLQDEVDAAKPPRAGVGNDAEAARASHRRLYEGLADLVAPLSRECRRAFNNTEPAVTEVGEPDYLGSSSTS